MKYPEWKILVLVLVGPVGSSWGQDFRVPGSQRAAVEGMGSASGVSNGPSIAGMLQNIKNASAEKRLRESHAANEDGVALYKKEEFAKALALFEEAVKKNPDEPIYKQNLANTKAAVSRANNEKTAVDRAMAKANQDTNDTAARMRQTMKSFTQSFGGSVPEVAADGLDFIGDIAVSSQVVSNLPRDLEDAIAQAYPKAPAAVTDRLRKAFQAVMVHDWKVARAWFGDALNQDPSNPGLKSFMAQFPEIDDPRLMLPAVARPMEEVDRRLGVRVSADWEIEMALETTRPRPTGYVPGKQFVYTPAEAVMFKRSLNLSDERFMYYLMLQEP